MCAGAVLNGRIWAQRDTQIGAPQYIDFADGYMSDKPWSAPTGIGKRVERLTGVSLAAFRLQAIIVRRVVVCVACARYSHTLRRGV